MSAPPTTTDLRAVTSVARYAPHEYRSEALGQRAQDATAACGSILRGTETLAIRDGSQVENRRFAASLGDLPVQSPGHASAIKRTRLRVLVAVLRTEGIPKPHAAIAELEAATRAFHGALNATSIPGFARGSCMRDEQ